MDGDVGEGTFAATPEAETAVLVLQTLQTLDINADRIAHCFRGGKTLRFEGGEHVLERSEADDARSDLLGAIVRVVDEIDDGISEFL